MIVVQSEPLCPKTPDAASRDPSPPKLDATGTCYSRGLHGTHPHHDTSICWGSVNRNSGLITPWEVGNGSRDSSPAPWWSSNEPVHELARVRKIEPPPRCSRLTFAAIYFPGFV